MADVGDEIGFRVVDAASAEAVGAMRSYFAELDARFEGGFVIGAALDDAAVWMNPPHGRFLVAERGGRVVGCGGVQRIDTSTVEIKRMWVDTSVRGVGLGKRLLARLEAEAADMGADRVVLDTNRVLTQAIAMYETAGYTPIGRYNDNPYAHHWFTKPVS
jgi:GNAT superfamily N-acetyltransferase